MPPRRAVTGRSQEPRQRFAEEVRSLRTTNRITLRQIGDRLGWDPSLFGKMESGDTIGSPEVVRALETFYNVPPGLLLALWELAAADLPQPKERYSRYIGLESEAVNIRQFAVSYLPGLLQTPEYARAVLAAGGYKGEELDEQVEVRIGRQRLLEGENAPPFRTILSEAVLRTVVRESAVWRAQLEHLLAVSERPGIVIQVLPFSAGPYALDATDLWLLHLPDGRMAAYTENTYSGELIEQSAEVERLQRRYDLVRDLAFSPAESLKFILRLLEEVPCDPSI
ncbi:helix-turn-helix transcriptional regulator [Streptomyces sp. NPDC046203]|uniref:helix-turn-helix domain-containing protein n=1 Tax=Streptomyces sp. NPDC046203 TaxID=3154602 RepID=UPI0033EA197E